MSPPTIKAALKEGEISKGHGKQIMSKELEVDDQLEIFKEIKSKALSVRQTEALVKKWKEAKKSKSGAAPSKEKKTTEDLFLKRVIDDLNRHLGTKVNIKANAKGKGSITIPFGSTKELNELLSKIKK